MTSKNVQRYYTLKCLISDFLSDVFFSQNSDFAPFSNFPRGQEDYTEPVKPATWSLVFRALSVLHEVELDDSKRTSTGESLTYVKSVFEPSGPSGRSFRPFPQRLGVFLLHPSPGWDANPSQGVSTTLPIGEW